jgi:hypothetical protein
MRRGDVRVGSQKAKFLKNCANVRGARMPGRQAQQIDDANRLTLPDAALAGSSRCLVHYRHRWRRATARKASRTETSPNSVAISGGFRLAWLAARATPRGRVPQDVAHLSKAEAPDLAVTSVDPRYEAFVRFRIADHVVSPNDEPDRPWVGNVTLGRVELLVRLQRNLVTAAGVIGMPRWSWSPSGMACGLRKSAIWSSRRSSSADRVPGRRRHLAAIFRQMQGKFARVP